MEDSERIQEVLKKFSRSSQEVESKLQVEWSLWQTRSTLVHEPQSRQEGLSDQQSTGPRLRFVLISEIVQEESKYPELEESKDIFEDEGYYLSQEEQMTQAQKWLKRKQTRKRDTKESKFYIPLGIPQLK